MKTSNTNKFYLTILFISIFISQLIVAQNVNPDFAGIKVRTKTETIYKSSNSSEDLKSTKSVIDSKGTIYTLFCDGNLGTAYLVSGNNGNWKTETLSKPESGSYADGESVYYVAMDIDNSDGLHVALVGYPSNIYVGYKPTGGTWKFETVSKDKMPHLHNFYISQNYIDMSVDAQKGIHIIAKADIDGKGNSAIYLFKKSTGQWSSELIREGVSNTKKIYGDDPSIIVSDNEIMTAFGGGYTLTYATKTIGSSKWQIDELINNESDYEPLKLSTSISLTPEAQPVIAFREYNASDMRGVNIITRDGCNNEWIRTAVFDESSNGNATVVDKFGVIWLAYNNDGDYTKLAYRSCNADRSFIDVITLKDLSKIFMDMFVDKDNHVHLFYSTYEDEIKHVEAWFDGDPKIDNNIIPAITSNMKPYIKTGDYWKTTLKAVDPECDQITFYSDNLPDGFTLLDHNNGLATLKSGTINQPGEYKVKVFVTDKNHQKGIKPLSGIDVTLVVSKDGKKNGSFKYIYDEGDISKNKWMNLDGTSSIVATTASNSKANTATNISDSAVEEPNSNQSADCKEYLDRYEAWADKYIEQKTKLIANPMDFNAVQKIAEMGTEIGNWALEWQNKHDCGYNDDFIKRYEKISNRIDEVQ